MLKSLSLTIIESLNLRVLLGRNPKGRPARSKASAEVPEEVLLPQQEPGAPAQ